MTILLPKLQRDKANDALRLVAEAFLYPNLPRHLQIATKQHLDWVAAQPEMYVNAKVETGETLQLTRITLEISHTAIPSLAPKQN